MLELFKNSILSPLADQLTLVSWVASLTGIVIGAGISAYINIFGDDLRAKLRRPRISIEIVDPDGEWTTLGRDSVSNAIYFHTLLENATHSRIAKNIELLIIECSVTDDSRQNKKLSLPSPLPIKCRRGDIGTKGSWIDIGAAPMGYDVMRCCLHSERLEILLNSHRPNSFKCWIKGAGSMNFTLQALGQNASSNKLFVNVEWDGVFPEESKGLGSHIKVKQSRD